MAQTTEEVKAAKAMVKAMNTLDFDPRALAYLLSLSSLDMRARVMLVFRHYVDFHEAQYRSGIWESPEEHELLIQAARLNDVMDQYEEN